MEHLEDSGFGNLTYVRSTFFCTKQIFGRVSASTLSPIWLFLVGVVSRWCQNRALLESTHAACSAFSTKDRRRTGELGVFARFRKKANDASLGIVVPRGACGANVVSSTGHHIDHHMETTMTPHWRHILAPHLAMSCRITQSHNVSLQLAGSCIIAISIAVVFR